MVRQTGIKRPSGRMRRRVAIAIAAAATAALWFQTAASLPAADLSPQVEAGPAAITPFRLSAARPGATPEQPGNAANASPPRTSGHPGQMVDDILALPEVRRGLSLVLGCDADFAAALYRRTRLPVQCLALDAQSVESARDALARMDVYGPVSIRSWSERPHLPYADDLVTLLVVTRPAAWQDAGLTDGELRRVLAPYGAAWLQGTGLGIKGLDVREADGCTVVTKPYPDGMDEWQQYGHDASDSMCSDDSIAGPVRSLRWVDHAADGVWRGSGHPVQIVSAGGRVFYGDMDARPESSSRTYPGRDAWLEARDAFNGLVLWKCAMVQGGSARVIAVGDRVYAPRTEAGGELCALDAATGSILQRLGIRGEVAYHGGFLLSDGGCKAWDAATGEPRWTVDVTFGRSLGTQLLFGEGKRFVICGESIIYRSGDPKQGAPSALRACALIDGRFLWECQVATNEDLLLASDGRVFTIAHGPLPEHRLDPRPALLRAYACTDGRFLWEYRHNQLNLGGNKKQTLMRSRDGQLTLYAVRPENTRRGYDKRGWVDHPGPHLVTLDAATGKELSAVYDANLSLTRCHSSCTTPKYWMAHDGGMRDALTGDSFRASRALRGACDVGYVPANGLIYQELNRCACYNSIRGAAAFSAVESGGPDEQPAHPETERFAAYAEAIEEVPAGEADWPTFRGDSLRRGTARTSLVAPLRSAWKVRLPGRLTQPTTAAGQVFIAVPERHLVVAVDAATGQEHWRHIAGGAVDSPPTYWRGRVLFGASDGSVTCLRAADGVPLWRLRAAPAECAIVAYGRIESLWPVHGSVLVQNGLAYAAAGRHPDTDGGIFLYSLDVRTGSVIWLRHIKGDDPALQLRRGFSAASVILQANDTHLFMDKVRVDRDTGREILHFADGKQDPGIMWCGVLGWLNAEHGTRYVGHANRTFRSYLGYGGHLLAGDGNRVFGAVHWGDGRLPGEARHASAFFTAREGDVLWASVFKQEPRLRVRSLLAAGDTLWAAVSPDTEDSDRGELWAYNATTGARLSTTPLAAGPVFEGLSAADGRLFVPGMNGLLECLISATDTR